MEPTYRNTPQWVMLPFRKERNDDPPRHTL